MIPTPPPSPAIVAAVQCLPTQTGIPGYSISMDKNGDFCLSSTPPPKLFAPTPSPAYVYHYDMPTQTCIDDLTGTVTCYDQPKFTGEISHEIIACDLKKPCAPSSAAGCFSSDVNGCGPRLTPKNITYGDESVCSASADFMPKPCIIPLKVNVNPGALTCLKDKHGYDTGWTLDVYDGNEKLLGSLRCKNGRLMLLRADTK